MIRCLAHFEQAGTLMRTTRFLTVISLFLVSFAFSANAQKTRKPVPRATPKPTPIKTTNPVVSAAKQQVANQLYNVNVFVDKMGPIAIAIENADKQASAGKLKKDAADANELNKKKIVAAIRGLRDGLVKLETDFRTNPQLTQYLPKIQGISTLCSQSEDSAIAGQFVASKDPLRQIALKLNDTLAVLPGPLPAGTTTAPSQNRTVPIQNVSTVKNPNVSSNKQDLSLGMTTSEVLASSWGAPNNKRVSTTSNGTTEVWSYSGNRALYFFNGKLTNIVQ